MIPQGAAYVIGVVIFVVGLLLSVGLHELGHMVPAKRFGVRVSQYMVGFGPTLWSRKRGETEYGFKAIPLGGYVRLVGMIPPASEVRPVEGSGWAARLIEDTRVASEEEVLPGQEARAFYRLAWWKKMIVMLGGPVMNLVIAVVVFTGIASIHGVPVVLPTVGTVSQCVLPAGADRDCAANDPPTAAVTAGLQAGDRIVSADGTAVRDWPMLVSYVRDHGGVPITLEVVRDGHNFALSVTPTAAVRAVVDASGAALHNADGSLKTETVGFLGMSPVSAIVRQNLAYGSIETAQILGKTAGVVGHLPQMVYHAGRAAFGLEDRDPAGVMSIVGVGRIEGEIASADVAGYTAADRVADFIGLIAALNLALFVFNLIPLLPLDGGHVASAIWQGVKNAWAARRKLPHPAQVDVARMMPLAYGVFGLLLAMGVLLMVADIVAPVPL